MKRSHKAFAAVIILIVAVGGGYYYSTSINPDVGDNITEWVEDNINISGLWKQEVLLTFEDGSTQLLSQAGLDPLLVQYQGQAVSDATWYLQARAETPAGAEPWDNVEVDTWDQGTFSLNVDISGGVLTDNINPTEAGYAYNILVPVDAPAGTWTTIFEYTLDFGVGNALFGSASFGTYTLAFTPIGNIYFRGVSTAGNGPWDTTTAPPGVSFDIEYLAGDEWDSDVTWETGADWTITP